VWGARKTIKGSRFPDFPVGAPSAQIIIGPEMETAIKDETNPQHEKAVSKVRSACENAFAKDPNTCVRVWVKPDTVPPC
jgi:hypothetical protein